ncbi:protein IQ-DOMAIN 3-like [Prosopis cineraria]|uniref:protein IQ-DOMAIN 3-like n=1 Tax=Prosopis cineraria TaxID=364024 RepID=UPI00240F907D|nr:protein IQ-DOMAIN 3-like [Prosopis cineraria]
MARKWGWFSAVKKVINPADSKKDQKNHKLKATWFAGPADLDPALSSPKVEPTFDAAPPLPSIGTEEEINENSKQAYLVDDATAVVAADAAIADAEVVHPTSHQPQCSVKTKEEIAAIKIQTAFRGYLARRDLHALRGLVRLKTMIQGHSIQQQAAATLRCMQTLAKVQSQIRERRIRMSEENQSLQRQLQRKQEKNKPQTTAGEEWDDSTKSKEEIKARLSDRKEAATRRERARTYSSLHQQKWKKASKSGNRTLAANMNPDWSWSWGERWVGSRPWDEKEVASMESEARRGSGSVGDHRHAQKPSRPPNPHSARPASRNSDNEEESRARQHQRRHSIAEWSIVKGKYSSSALKLCGPSTTRRPSFPSSASKRHSCPPEMQTFLENQKARLEFNS